MGERRTKVANGNILPFQILVQDLTTDGRVLAASSATATAFWGVSFPGQRQAPWAPLQDTFAAIQGENVGIYGPEDNEILVKIGTGNTVVRGDLLTTDASGFALTTTTTGQYLIGRALKGGVAADLIPIEVLDFWAHP
jgi:hypothetical protein